ncbi:hypothetical protein OPV22_015223 [Ensete ventricosum]|uniref:Uncharacterized protein n=1 Tax=Ensete ventricosum TaxID=4639 RepID=A0AAV8R9U2_ENSVE|nr:hypothetical protein OPV22_015223 [Ensete ventricosum]RWW25846.1 hypothetical protein GW17_00009797 [Ensete ventricosum]RWW74372.1 hypothetical protein BHE74_00017687 [Ensete ventricosum]RZR84050.1 hypothetical protein BHM03_00010789 [Ensete ventricosum]
MAHSLPLLPRPTSPPSSPATQRVPRRQHLAEPQFGDAAVRFHRRRQLIYGLVAVGVACSVAPQGAHAVKRRPSPPPPPEEKVDPNVSGVVAKVLASKKRKEAMKEAVAKLREQGKSIDGPSP